EQRRIPVRHRRDQRYDFDSRRHGGDCGKRGVALEMRLAGIGHNPAHEKVIIERDGVEAEVFGAPGKSGQVGEVAVGQGGIEFDWSHRSNSLPGRFDGLVWPSARYHRGRRETNITSGSYSCDESSIALP